MLVILAACGTDNSTDGAAKDDKIEEEPIEVVEEIVETEAFPVTFTDDAGREVTLDSEPQTMVSVQASNTEILYALGVGDRLIGVSDYCNYPAEALSVQKVGAQD